MCSDLSLCIEEAGPPVELNGYESQLAFGGLDSQEQAIGGRGAAARGRRSGIGCDGMAYAFRLDPTLSDAIAFCLQIIELLQAAGYEILWIDFGKYVAYRFGGSYHLLQNELRRIAYHRGTSTGAATQQTHFSDRGDLKTYTSASYRREDMRRNDAMRGRGLDFDFDFHIAMHDTEPKSLAMEKALKAVRWGMPCGRALPIKQRYCTGNVCDNFPVPRTGEDYCNYMLVKVKKVK